MRILVVSNHQLVGQSLVSTLRRGEVGPPVEAEFCEAARAVAVATASAPDVVLVEGVVDFASGLALVRLLTDSLPGLHVVMLGTDDDEASIFEAVNAGADGFLAGDASLGMLPRMLAGVTQGELGLPRVAALRVVRQLRRAARQQRTQPAYDTGGMLTQREQEVFALVRQGMRSREISERLTIAEATVYKHIQNVLEKLNVHSRAQAIVVTQRETHGESHSGAHGGTAAPPSSPLNITLDAAGQPQAPARAGKHSPGHRDTNGSAVRT